MSIGTCTVHVVTVTRTITVWWEADVPRLKRSPEGDADRRHFKLIGVRHRAAARKAPGPELR